MSPRRSLLRRLEFARKPFERVGIQRVRALAIDALELALSFAAGRQRKDQRLATMGAVRSFGLSHVVVL